MGRRMGQAFAAAFIAVRLWRRMSEDLYAPAVAVRLRSDSFVFGSRPARIAAVPAFFAAQKPPFYPGTTPEWKGVRR